jgi:hypothetical protein
MHRGDYAAVLVHLDQAKKGAANCVVLFLSHCHKLVEHWHQKLSSIDNHYHVVILQSKLTQDNFIENDLRDMS